MGLKVSEQFTNNLNVDVANFYKSSSGDEIPERDVTYHLI